ncbi:response regulator [Pelomonas sp. SE-A7]|uniref:response regulator n=1 Tax=Pelomonas sp. SE-A7 TaxID=3054953 RepID=UPI00259CC8E7|nr:response regulator [Pelomonas sp. SE-A7]MDM4768128.1 response regulator [Pelomonas sp. SE-A7]
MSDSAPLRFLIVDALAGVQTFARQLLQGYGFPTDSLAVASDTVQALELGRQQPPDFLICDDFPKSELDAFALFEQLKQANPGCRLALLSFEITPELEAKASQAGARFLLKKPFAATDLRDALRKSLDALAQERPDLHARMMQVMKPPAPAKSAAPPRPIVLPPMQPALKPGDKVSHAGKTSTIEYIVIRHGELAVQLRGQSGLVPAAQLTKL